MSKAFNVMFFGEPVKMEIFAFEYQQNAKNICVIHFYQDPCIWFASELDIKLKIQIAFLEMFQKF